MREGRRGEHAEAFFERVDMVTGALGDRELRKALLMVAVQAVRWWDELLEQVDDYQLAQWAAAVDRAVQAERRSSGVPAKEAGTP